MLKMIKRTLKAESLGRITIPKDLRDMLGIDGKDRVEVMYDNTQLIIPKVNVKAINENMDEVMRIASNSSAINDKELSELESIIDKLRNELNQKER